MRSRMLTEPAIRLYALARLVLLIEAKFTSGNTLSKESTALDKAGEEPKFVACLASRYGGDLLASGSLNTTDTGNAFYGWLYRNLVFAIWMAHQLGVKWRLVNLLSGRYFKGDDPAYRDPTSCIRCLLPSASRRWFIRDTWEQLFKSHAAGGADLPKLAAYLRHKCAHREQAFNP